MTRAAAALRIAAGLACVLPVQAEARVTRVVIESERTVPEREGVAEYRIVGGVFHGELDPSAAANAVITDLRHAPRNARGKVEYAATFVIARPADPARGSGVLFYDVPNRGTGAVAPDRDGHVRVISGWQGDLAPGAGVQRAHVPIARRASGQSLTGLALVRLQDLPAGTVSTRLVAGIGRAVQRPAPVSVDTRQARLTVEKRGQPVRAIAPRDWAFADCSGVPFPGVPDPGQLCVKGGFLPDAVYTLTYRAKDPLVLGVGFAATRDLVAFLRSGQPDDAGTPNPAGPVNWTVASGRSQSGNFLRSFVHLGFNADESGKRVFDGINPDIAARLLPLNIRFGVPGGAARPLEPGSEGTLWWGRYRDRRRGLPASSLLDACTRTQTCPKVIETFGSAEFWGLRASPGLVGTDALTDLPLPANVRRYYFASVTHGGSMGSRFGGFVAQGDPVPPGCRWAGNPNPSHHGVRAAQRALVRWVRDGIDPPPSRYPTLAAGDLVEPAARAMGWPAIPGFDGPDGKINPLPIHDFGGGFNRLRLSGAMTRQPPAIGGVVPLLVPRVDADGNEIAGLRSVLLRVPLGTYTGFNVTRSGFEAGQGCGFAGGFIPFARTRAERERTGDPRLSLEERYGSRDAYLARVRAEAAVDVASGWLPPAEAAQIIRQAAESEVLK